MEIRDNGIDYQELHLFHFMGSNAKVSAIANRILAARDFGEPKGQRARSFYRAPKEEFSRTTEIVSYLHVQKETTIFEGKHHEVYGYCIGRRIRSLRYGGARKYGSSRVGRQGSA